MNFAIQPPLEVRNQVDKLAEEMRKLLGLTKGSVLIKFSDREVAHCTVQVDLK